MKPKTRLFTISAVILCYALVSFAQTVNTPAKKVIASVLETTGNNIKDSLMRVDSIRRDSVMRIDSIMKRDSIFILDSIRIADSLKIVNRNKPKPKKPVIKIITVALGDSSTINFDSIQLKPSQLFMPFIYEHQESFNDSIFYMSDNVAIDKMGFDYDNRYLDSLLLKSYDDRRTRYRMMLKHPEMVKYNITDLPEPPKQYEIVADPSTRTLKLEEAKLETDITDELEVPVIEMRNWIHSFEGSMQFSQAYLSDNWYQGGNNNLNILANVLWSVNLNQNVHPNLLFENTVQYKVGLSSAPQDTMRNYSISEDLFQVNTKFGYKAIKNWYYSATMQFKTQFFNNYASNSTDLNASFLTPGELNLGLGMTYGTKSKSGYASFDLSLSPASFNMKICRENDRVDPTTMGVDAGKHIKGELGSNMEAKLSWAITPTISWTSRFYAFTNYHYVQGDWENTFNFSINKYLSTQLYVHLRYDDSAESASDWGNWQLKEILSFGLNYKFSMK